MKAHYLTPTTEMLLLNLEETICGVSGKGFTIQTGTSASSFDDDSD
jgi:hypothetical protein